MNQSSCCISVRLFFLFVRALSFQGHTKVALSDEMFGEGQYNYFLYLHDLCQCLQPLQTI